MTQKQIHVLGHTACKPAIASANRAEQPETLYRFPNVYDSLWSAVVEALGDLSKLIGWWSSLSPLLLPCLVLG